MYESEHTRFIRELMQQHPELPQKQREGRGIWWDKSLNSELYEGFAASNVPQSPYVYQSGLDEHQHEE